MGFQFERIIDGDSVKENVEYKKAVELGGGIPISSYVVDRDAGATLYCLSVGGGPENEWPGHYLLFYREELVHIKAMLNEKWEEGVGNVATYQISDIDYPKSLKTEKSTIINLVRQALKVKGLSYPVPPSMVKVEI